MITYTGLSSTYQIRYRHQFRASGRIVRLVLTTAFMQIRLGSGLLCLAGEPPGQGSDLQTVLQQLLQAQASLSSFSVDYSVAAKGDSGAYAHRRIAMMEPCYCYHDGGYGSWTASWENDPLRRACYLTSTEVFDIQVNSRMYWTSLIAPNDPLVGSLPYEWLIWATGYWPLTDRPAPRLRGSVPFVLRDYCAESADKVLRHELELVDGRLCHVLERPGIDILWIDSSRDIVMARTVLDEDIACPRHEYYLGGHQEIAGIWVPTWIRDVRQIIHKEHDGTLVQTKQEFAVRLANWRINDLTPDSFRFVPPGGAIQFSADDEKLANVNLGESLHLAHVLRIAREVTPQSASTSAGTFFWLVLGISIASCLEISKRLLLVKVRHGSQIPRDQSKESFHPNCKIHGLTLVELVVVIAIIGMLMAILIPAVGSARRSARQTACASQIRQLGIACLLHDAAQKHFPTGGWGAEWLGFSNRGYGVEQPGGWIFNVLDYCEHDDVRNIAPIAGEPIDPARLSQFVNSVVPILLCPEKSGRTHISVSKRYQFISLVPGMTAARGDYAINGGTQDLDNFGGPLTLDPTQVSSFPWPSLASFDGISWVRTTVRPRTIKDGLTHVFLIGERHSQPADVFDQGENQPIFSGDCWDIRRGTYSPLARDGGSGGVTSFGSSHTNACQFTMCDGSVHAISFDIDPIVYRRLGGTNDGGTL